MNTVRFIKSFSKGQITIPKEFRDFFGIGDEFWLKLHITDGKLIAEVSNRMGDPEHFMTRFMSNYPNLSFAN